MHIVSLNSEGIILGALCRYEFKWNTVGGDVWMFEWNAKNWIKKGINYVSQRMLYLWQYRSSHLEDLWKFINM